MTAIRSPLAVEGTPESEWRQWSAPASWPRLATALPDRVVLATPHPDDETLGVGGLVSMLTGAGVPVDVVAVTDGEGSHTATAERSAAALAAWRRHEQHDALALLGVERDRVARLGVPDGAVASHRDAVVDALARATRRGDWLLATWQHDGHRDHDALGLAAAAAAARSGARLLSYPVWAWHWARPDDPALRSWRPLRVDLPHAARRAKQAALACYSSQIRPQPPDGDVIVKPSMLERHRRDWEVVLT